MLLLQHGDIEGTFADVSDLMDDQGYQPSTGLEKGISCF